MNGNDLRQAIDRCLSVYPEYADELGDLDQALGDGDLGITVSLGAAGPTVGEAGGENASPTPSVAS